MPAHNQKQNFSLTDIYEKISLLETRQAYLYLLANSARLKGYHTNSSGAGDKKHFGYWNGNSYQFAFIGNASWLLFYFRIPLFESYPNSKAETLLKYPNAVENEKGELTIKITTLLEAQELQQFVESLI